MLSSGEGLDSLQQLMPGEDIESIEFSDALMKKLDQLQGLAVSDPVSEGLVLDELGGGNKLHEIASLINGNGSVSGLFGKSLPPGNKFEEDIDLENTLEALAKVLNTLDEGGQEEDITIQLDGLIDNINEIKSAVPEYVGLSHKLEQLTEKVEVLKIQESTNRLDSIENVDQALAEVYIPVDGDEHALSSMDKSLTDDAQAQANMDEQIIKNSGALAENDAVVSNEEQLEYLDKIRDEILQVQDLVSGDQTLNLAGEKGLEHQLEHLAAEIERIKNSVTNKISTRLNSQESDVDVSMDSLDEQAVSDADIASQISALVSTLGESKSSESVAINPVYQEVKAGLNKENLSLKQMAEVQSLEGTAKSESETSLQQDNVLSKPDQNSFNSVFMAKPKEIIRTVDAKEPETGLEKVLPKFATDIAHLNRAVMAENKAEIPPMTKHFAHPEWNKEIAERVVWMHKQAVPSAELRLNPGHLGPITIKIDVTQDQATVAFTAQHAAVKEAIDAALPKLREMFSAQQLNLGEVSVSQEDAGQKQHRGFSQMGSDAGQGEKESSEMTENEQPENLMDIADEIEAGRAIASHGMLSIFA